MTTRARALLLLALLTGAGSSACGDAGPTAEISARRTASRPSSPVLPGAGPRERFAQRAPRDEPSDDVSIDYALPEGWKVLARTSERFVNLQPAGDPDSVCYLSMLPGAAGGLEANVNRWRTQMGAEPITGDEIAALPEAELMGGRGKLVEVSGTFTGMSGELQQPGFALLGIILSNPQGSLFLKLTAPAAVAQAERERFLALAQSLHVVEASEEHGPGDGHDHGPNDGHDHGEQASTTEGGETDTSRAVPIETHHPLPESQVPSAESAGGANGLAWKAPAGWKAMPAKPMREVTFALPGGGECYVSRLSMDAGGLKANLDRWRDQVGLPPLDEAGLAKLERVEVLGESVPLLDLTGTFKGMDGSEQAGQGLIGVALIREHESLFVKLVAPEASARAERAAFLAFVASLEERP